MLYSFTHTGSSNMYIHTNCTNESFTALASQLVIYCFLSSSSYKLIYLIAHVGSPADMFLKSGNFGDFKFSAGLRPLRLHLWRGSSVSGRAAFHLRSCSHRGWCTALWGTCRGWAVGSRRSVVALSGPFQGKVGCPALMLHGAAVLCGEMRGSSVDCWVPAGSGCPTGEVALAQGS